MSTDISAQPTLEHPQFHDVETAVSALADGRIVVVVDDTDRENEGDLVMAAQFATDEKLAFFVRHTSGVVCVALPGDRCDALDLPLMVPPSDNDEGQGTAFTVTVDARVGTSTGISASDRAITARALADPAARAADFVRPGHVLPLRARPDGVLERPGHTEASVDLCRLAGLHPAALLCEVIRDDGAMARRDDLFRFARLHDLPIVTIADLVAYRRGLEQPVVRVAGSRLPSDWGEFQLSLYRAPHGGPEHLAITAGDPAMAEEPLVRIHSECFTGDVLRSRRCDCGAQLRDALKAIAEHGDGVVIYMRGHEGRGIGLRHKLDAYQLQDDGYDTVDANLALGLPVDGRDFAAAALILKDLGVARLRLLTNNPMKCAEMTRLGVDVTARVPMPPGVTQDNVHYLRTKKARLGHLIEELSVPATSG